MTDPSLIPTLSDAVGRRAVRLPDGRSARLVAVPPPGPPRTPEEAAGRGRSGSKARVLLPSGAYLSIPLNDLVLLPEERPAVVEIDDHPLDVRLPTCRTWRGNSLPPPGRHSGQSSFLAPIPVEFGWISACDLCDWTRRDGPKDADGVERRRVEHLTTAHRDLLLTGRATIHLNRGART